MTPSQARAWLLVAMILFLASATIGRADPCHHHGITRTRGIDPDTGQETWIERDVCFDGASTASR